MENQERKVEGLLLKVNLHMLKVLQISIALLICNVLYGQNAKKSAFYFYKKGLNKEDIGENFKAYESFLKAKKIYKIENKKDSVAICNLNLFDIIITQDSLNYDPKFFLDECYNYAIKSLDTVLRVKAYFKYAHYFFDANNKEKSASYYKKILSITNKKKQIGAVYGNLALLYTKTSPDSASYFFKKALNIYDEEQKNQFFSTYINYANFFANKKDFKNAINQLKEAEKITPDNYQIKFKHILYRKFSNYYTELKDYKTAFKYLKKSNTFKDSLNYVKQNIAISEINEKYDNEKLRADNLIIESKRKQNKNLFFGVLAILFFSIIIYYQNLKNSRRKRLFAEQQKELEQQKNITLIKEQEIVTINAMVNGQEKERIRIAEDLHDNIGSVLATLKLHFENLKLNREKKHFNQDELYQKTEKLIDETYFKVRNLAHAKNAGVIANKGLLTAVKIMAEKISDANKIQIEVLDYGLGKRLENTLELTVFRIIQELTTNIIKHAEATNATINISAYDNNLNIIIEDNGKGFVFKENELKKEGIGLGSIKTRIQHLNGTFGIDSTIDKGTSVLIDIPVI